MYVVIGSVDIGVIVYTRAQAIFAVRHRSMVLGHLELRATP